MYIMLPIIVAVRIGNDEDRKYLEELYNETYRALVSYADSILQCREDSLDQVQALFLDMTGHIKALRELHSPYCYLKKCLTHRIFNLINERAAKPCWSMDEFEEKYGALPDVSAAVEGAVIRNEAYLLLRAYVQNLKPLYRSFIILHYYYGLKIKDVSRLLDVTPEYASVIHKRAKEELKRLISKGEVT